MEDFMGDEHLGDVAYQVRIVWQAMIEARMLVMVTTPKQLAVKRQYWSYIGNYKYIDWNAEASCSVAVLAIIPQIFT